MKTILSTKRRKVKFQLDKHIAGWWTFYYTGKLEHPNGVNSSWFRKEKSVWFIDEWACDLTPEVEVALVDAVREVGGLVA